MTVEDLRRFLEHYPQDMEVRFISGMNDEPINGLAKFNFSASKTGYSAKEFVGLYN